MNQYNRTDKEAIGVRNIINLRIEKLKNSINKYNGVNKFTVIQRKRLQEAQTIKRLVNKEMGKHEVYDRSE